VRVGDGNAVGIDGRFRLDAEILDVAASYCASSLPCEEAFSGKKSHSSPKPSETAFHRADRPNVIFFVVTARAFPERRDQNRSKQ
jgi:hypothetical protein